MSEKIVQLNEEVIRGQLKELVRARLLKKLMINTPKSSPQTLAKMYG